MPWTKEAPPDVAKNWSDAEKSKCVAAGNTALRDGKKEEEAIFACIAAAGKANMSREETLDVEIMRAGTWYGTGCPKDGCKFTEEDLHDMVTNFQILKDEHKAPLKRGHAVEVGDVALGWVNDLWVEGDKLIGKFADMPSVVREAIRKKLFRKVSIEAMRNVMIGGKKLKGWVLDAVALLGAEIPAVSGLKDLDTYLAARSFEHGPVAMFSTINGNLNEQEQPMDKELEDRLKALEKSATTSSEAIIALTKERDDLKTENAKMKRESDDQKTAERKTKVDFNRAEVTKVLEQAVKDKLILPAQREIFSKLLKTTDDEAMFTVAIDDVKKLIDDGGRKVNFSKEQGKANGGQEQRKHEDAGEELNRLARAKIDENPKLKYDRALELAMESNPELAMEHIGALSEEA